MCVPGGECSAQLSPNPGAAHVLFPTVSEAMYALMRMHGQSVQGRPLHAKFSSRPVEKFQQPSDAAAASSTPASYTAVSDPLGGELSTYTSTEHAEQQTQSDGASTSHSEAATVLPSESTTPPEQQGGSDVDSQQQQQ